MAVAFETGPESRLLSVGDAAKLARVHPSTIRAWCDSGKLVCVRIDGRRDRRIARRDLDRLLASSEPSRATLRPEPPTPTPQAAQQDAPAPSLNLGRHRAVRLAALQVAIDISDRLELPALYSAVLDHATALFGAHKVAFWLVDSSAEPCRPAAQHGLGVELIDVFERIHRTGSSPFASVLTTRQIRVVTGADLHDANLELGGLLRTEAIRTVCLVPVSHADELLGVLALYYPTSDAWRPYDLELARAFAAQIGTAIKNARLYASVRNLEARLRSIQDLTLRLNRIQDVQGIGETIVDEASALIEYDSVRVYVVDHEKHVCEPLAFRGRFMGLPSLSLDQLRISVGQGLTGWAAEHNQAVLTGDAARDPRGLTLGEVEGPESLLVVPMSYDDRVLGLIVISKNGRDRFGPDDLTTISIFAGHAAQAIENAENFERVRLQQSELEHQLASQRKLLEVNEQLLSTLDPHGVLEMIADSLKSVVAYDTLSIYRVDRATATRRAVLARHRFVDVILSQVIPMLSGLSGWAVEHREAVLANDAHLDSRAMQIPGTPYEPESMVIVPLQMNGEVVGTLNVGRIGEHAHFTTNEFELTKLFAGQASIGLQNAEAHEAVEARADRDSLTGLRNHGSFQRELDALIGRGPGAPFALLMMDLNGFKAYNDSLGHPAGDRLLRDVASRLTAVTREVDKVYRYGGDEFAILLPGAKRQDALEVAERVRQTVDGLSPRHRAVHVGISVGIACYPDEGSVRDDLVAGADAMLYLSKPPRLGHGAALPGAFHDQSVGALHDAVLGLLDRLEPSELPAAIVTRAGTLMGTSHGFLSLVEADGSAIRCRAGSGLFEPLLGTARAPGEGLTGKVWQAGQLMVVDDYATWQDRVVGLGVAGSVAAVPLISRARVIGVLGLCSGSPDRIFTDREIAIFKRFAELTAVALDNAELYTAAQREVKERRLAEERLSSQALYDALTGLPNRDLLMDRLRHALARGERAGTASAVLFLDLDRFKFVNDTLGHSVGDRLLVGVARRLSNCLRPGDTVARFGGDEFVILLEAVVGLDEAIRIADRISDELVEPFALEGRDAFVTASIGIALAQPGRVDAGEILRNADIALYQAKADAATRHAVFEPEMSAPSRDRLELENDLRRAIDRGELRLWFQPLVDLATGRLVGHEALVRWQHPTRGLLPPASFIPLAEETGLILPLGQWVMNAACRQARLWRDADPNGPRLTMAVNLSAREFAQRDLLTRVAGALEDNGLEASALELEITETIVMSDAEAVIMTLHQLRGLGVHLVLDDFGTGYSSLSYLRNLPLNVLKVDRSFVAAVTSDPATLSIVRAVVGLAHGLEMSVTAEGIETPEQLSTIQELGCDLGQGYLFGEAMPPERLEELGLVRAR